jgi:DNA-binding HxlR family transcriptional regulator
MKTRNMLVILSRSHAMEILNELSKIPLRFMDMDSICKSKRTRYARLKELEEKGLIKAVPKLIGHKSYTFYEITDVGIEALNLGRNLLSLEKSMRD